ncbi:MAG: hypothetical protein Q4A28_08175 [Brachymonas sp.]|nr:hypothetical protein [Brachymonas sp.]
MTKPQPIRKMGRLLPMRVMVNMDIPTATLLHNKRLPVQATAVRMGMSTSMRTAGRVVIITMMAMHITLTSTIRTITMRTRTIMATITISTVQVAAAGLAARGR